MKLPKNIAFLLTFSLLCIEILAQPSREWTVVASYPIPGKASGLAWDGTYLYSGLYATAGDNSLIYRINPSNGSYAVQCTGPQETSYGLTFDGTYLWTTDHPNSSQPANAIQFNMSGGLVSQFALPTTYMSGIAWDNNRFWACAYYNPDGMTYKLTNSGTIITSFPTPNAQPWDICKQGQYLWVADYYANMLYKTDTLGNTLESHPSVGSSPSGVVWDGQYLWYCDGELSSQSTLYKVDLGGSGTPEINVPQDSHDYGIVTIGDSPTWDMAVQNTGTGDLVITALLIPDAVPIFTDFAPPQTIMPGTYITIPLTYQPTDPIALNTEITIVSSDPVTPEAPVTLTGNAVLNGPHLLVSANDHDYGNVRLNACTRWFLEVSNNGSEMLMISQVNINGTNFTLDAGTFNALPLIINSLDTVKIGIWFNPLEAVPYGEFLNIVHNGTNTNPYQVYLSGTGLEQDWPIGDLLWYYTIDDNYDNSPKAISSIDDVTGDKVADVIVCSEDDIVRCFNGNSNNLADVIWERPIYAGTTYSQNGLTIIDDINGDQMQDVIVGTAWGDRAVTAFSGKTGEQLWKFDTHQYGDGGWVYQVDARFDYNNDGVKDVLAATGDDANGTGPMRIFCLNALNGAKIWDCYTGGPNFSVVGIEDFNGDNIPDVLAGASDNAESQGKVYGISGENGSIKWTYTTTGSSVWGVEQLGDINNDGIPDVAAGDFSGHVIYLDASDGGVLKTVSIGSVLITRIVRIEDVNNDFHADLMICNSGTNAVTLSGADASTIWSKPMPDKPWNMAGSNDLSGDGISDVLVGTLYSSNYLYFLDGINGEQLEAINFGEAVDAINSIPDIVGDGSYEMVGGGREGAVNCYSGGIHSLAAVPEHPKAISASFHSTAWPNPSSGTINIGFYLPNDQHVTVDIYSASGKLIGRIFESDLSKGDHVVTWDGISDQGTNCASGIYLYRIIAGKAHSTGEVIR